MSGADRPILIAGAGIGGLAAALALAEIGISVEILEKRRDVVETGAGIQIGPNGTRLLIKLGVADRLAASIAVPDAIIARSGITGRTIAELPLGQWIAERHGAPYWTTHRQDLHRALLTAVAASPRIVVTRGFELASLRESADTIAAIAIDGRTVNGRGLLGADGVWSKVRDHIAPGATPRDVGKSAARTVLAMEHVPAGLGGNVTGLWLSPASHLVHYPIRQGRDMALVLIVEDAAHDQAGDRYWDRDVPPGWIEARTTSLTPLARELLAECRDWQRWSLVSGAHLPSWSHRRATLLGDAAHPILPFLAQGAAMALEDAAVLADCLGRARLDVPRAFDKYQRERIARTRRVADAARRNGQIYHLSGIPAAARDFAMGRAGGARLMASYDWLYGWQPPVTGSRGSPTST